MSRRVILDVASIQCTSDHGQGVPCDGHSIRLVHHITSDTVELTIDGVHQTFDDAIWGKIIQAEIEDDEKLRRK